LTPLASSPHFLIGDIPFRFIAAIVPGWFWAHGEGISPEDVTEDLIVSAKASGISMIHLPVPISIENPIGVFSEDDFGDLDFLLDTAARNGLYVMPVLMEGYGLAEQREFAYYNPAGFAGLILDQRLSDAYRERIRTFIFRRNSINGRLYRDDPTIFGWDIMAEPSGYPTSPVLTLPQIEAWFEETAAYVRSLDPNHLVGVNSTGSFDSQYPEYRQTWYHVFDVPSLDFVEFEENAAAVTSPEDYALDERALGVLSLGKPVINLVVMPIYSPSDPTCTDYVWQARFIHAFALRNYEAGMSAISVTSWASDLAPWLPDFDICIIKTDSTVPIPEVMLEIASQLNVPGYPNPPLHFVGTSP
jgi:mannan endo-1,4-beta-mannosidase